MLAGQIKRLVKQSAIYGLGGIVSRLLAVLLLPLYTSYLGTDGFGKIETIVALTTVLVVVLRMGISSAFFRFYFDSTDEARRTLVVRTSFWFTMAMATAGLVAGCILATPLAHLLRLGDDPWLVRAGFVGLWAQMNYEQLTSLFRVEERPVAFVAASIANIFITVGDDRSARRRPQQGTDGRGRRQLPRHAHRVLRAARVPPLPARPPVRPRPAARDEPLRDAARARRARALGDQLHRPLLRRRLQGAGEVGVYSLAVRISSVIVFLMVAFRLAWPAFAYSIEDESVAKRTYAFVLTYLLFICCWASLVLGLLSPWIVRILAPNKPAFYRASEAVGILAFAGAAYAGYTVLAIGIGRARRTQFNWVITGAAALAERRAELRADPALRDDGRRDLDDRRVRRDVHRDDAERAARLAGSVPVAARRRRSRSSRSRLLVLGKAVSAPLPLAIALCLVYPVVLLPLRFYLPAELRRLRLS